MFNTAGALVAAQTISGTIPGAIAPSFDGAMYWFDAGHNDLAPFFAAGATIPLSPGSGLSSITSGPDGALWFTEQTAARSG